MKMLSVLSAILLCSLALTAFADTLQGRVVTIADGDTITVLDADKVQHKIRLTGIDAPEKAQAFGKASKKSLSDMIFGHEVDVKWDKRDRYGRFIGKISANQTDVCLEQVRRGMAWHYQQYQRDQSPADRQAYAAAEDLAHANHVGLWDFRHRCSTRDIS